MGKRLTTEDYRTRDIYMHFGYEKAFLRYNHKTEETYVKFLNTNTETLREQGDKIATDIKIFGIEITKEEYEACEISKLTSARQFAIKVHGEQKYGDAPYVSHLDNVVTILREFGYSDEGVLCAGFLHDCLEDTDAEPNDLQDMFGEDVLTMVAFCTDEEGADRKTRKKRTYERMKKTLDKALSSDRATLENAVAVKLADRLSNVRACARDGKENLLNLYRDEHTTFRKTLHIENTHDAFWGAFSEYM